MQETALYAPIKRHLEAQGYSVKSEVAGADVVALRGDDPDPVIVEMKTAFSLSLVQQGIVRQSISDWVYLAVPTIKGRKTLGRHLGLCRRLGLGLITVRAKDGHVEVHCDPAPFAPRKIKVRRDRLLREFSRRVGDPNIGGSNRVTLITAYRLDAMRCAKHLADAGPSKGAVVASATGVARATTIMRDDHYGWFERVAKGIYQLTPKGQAALPD
ncbi:DUF2161 domain-containing phosphodiesterase [Heliomarina baculiformis]|uniref:DUF2161 domain-containing phosphodiesterase n=1 Tax=Heliomarina baculiformis TaxID=2872036 RepID=UPI001EE230DD|nr:DUF2161 family putative PD-(D/E)XK-type phosphodiesterase [Heliomarina baculiformis]